MKDLSHLPKRPPREGLIPDEQPRFVQVLAEQWAGEADDNKPTALGTPFRHSDAGKCARAISFTAAGIPASDLMDLTGVWNTTLGSLIHLKWQEALLDRYPEADIEVTCRTDGTDGSGHIDAVVKVPQDGDIEQIGPYHTIAIELKTIGGYGYKAAVGAARKGTPAEGPKTEHIMQAALNGMAVDADEVIIAYLSKETISVNVAERFGISELERFCCEWTFTRQQFEPIAIDEAKRVDQILKMVKSGKLAPRHTPEMPKGARIIDPTTGAWTLEDEREGTTYDTGSYWGCGYCKYRTVCADTGSGAIPITDVKAVTA